jgi:hypothetical protein
MNPLSLVGQLRQAVDAHDLDGVVGCFAPAFRNETPAHPGRSFVGAEQVRANWAQIFGAVPDITATVGRTVVDNDVVWSEWELAGTRRDGVPQMLRGVIIFGVEGDTFAWNRFYLEPVDAGEGGVHAAISRMTAST